MHKNDNRRKEIYHEYDWCYQKFIAEGLNHQQIAEIAGTTVRTIKKWVVEKHRITNDVRRKIKKFNKIQEDLIIGSLLGDGHITNKKYVPIFIVSHSEEEKDYLYWKYEILKDFCNQKPALVESTMKKFGDEEYLAKDAYRINTRVHDDLIRFRDMPIMDVIERLNEFSLSIWLFDDGSRSRSNWDVCVAPYSRNEKGKIIKVMEGRFNLKCKLHSKDSRYLKFDAPSSRKIDDMILKNIPNELDVVKKKIINKYISKPANYSYIVFNGETMSLTKFIKSNKLNYEYARSMYLDGETNPSVLIDKCSGVKVGDKIG